MENKPATSAELIRAAHKPEYFKSPKLAQLAAEKLAAEFCVRTETAKDGTKFYYFSDGSAVGWTAL